MNTKERKATLTKLGAYAGLVQRAAEGAGRGRLYDRLVSEIRRDAKAHRAMGMRWAGVGGMKGRITLKQEVEYFVVKTLAHGLRHWQSPMIEGLRFDFAIGTMLASNGTVRQDLEASDGFAEFVEFVESLDYATLQGGA